MHFFSNPYNFVSNISVLFVVYIFSEIKNMAGYHELVFMYNATVFVFISVTFLNYNDILPVGALYNEEFRKKCSQ